MYINSAGTYIITLLCKVQSVNKGATKPHLQDNEEGPEADDTLSGWVRVAALIRQVQHVLLVSVGHW